MRYWNLKSGEMLKPFLFFFFFKNPFFLSSLVNSEGQWKFLAAKEHSSTITTKAAECYYDRMLSLSKEGGEIGHVSTVSPLPQQYFCGTREGSSRRDS